MLVVVSAFAVAVLVIATWHFFRYRTDVRNLNSKIQTLQFQTAQLQVKADRLEETRRRLASNCVELSTREFDIEHDVDATARAVDKCMSDFPADETLPAFKARVYATAFAKNHAKADYLVNALQAAQLSNKIKPNMDGYEWQALTYCLQSAYGPASGRKAACTSAINSFHQEFTLDRSRMSSIGRMEQFQDYCSAEIQRAALDLSFHGGC
jgi:outer membrane murein-binding lipoprotein Lpp